MSLSRDVPIPLYSQLEEILRKRIEDGTYAPGSMLPTEHQLEKEYAVSRTTVRQAAARLVLAGRVTRAPGRGTFVTERRRVRHRGVQSIVEDLVAPQLRR